MRTVAGILQYARHTDLTGIVRVPKLDYSFVSRILDSGAEGVWIPHLDTEEQARQLVSFAKYPPQGKRGAAVPAFRMREFRQAPNAAAFFKDANEQVLVIAQIESAEAVDNIAAIVAVEGIDVAVMGTMDLSLDIGYPGQRTHPEVRKLVQRVVDACQERGCASGTHLGAIDELRYWIGQGMRMITYSYETSMLMEKGSEALKALKA
jgi:2-dehydro-3-deoxyglucarate aldolase/4-hydroxy-2-oxoheptanedioate aldolase